MSTDAPSTSPVTHVSDRGDSDPLFRALVEQSWECIILLDAKAVVLFANPAIERVLGWTPQESLHDSAFDFIHPDDLPSFQARFADLLQHPGQTRTSDFRSRRKDGSWRWLTACATNLLEDPRAAAIVCNVRDVTAERHALVALRQSEGHYRALIEQATEGIWVTSINGICLEANEAAARMLGYSIDELVGIDLITITHPEDCAERARTIKTLLDTGTAAAVRRLRKKDGGYIVVEGAGRLLEGDRCLVCFRDITARRHSEERERFLYSAGEVLSRSLNYRETLDRVARLTIPRLADYCLIDIVGKDEAGNQTVERMVIAHRDPAEEAVLREIQRRWPVSAASPSAAGRILRNPGTELIRELTPERVSRYALDEDHAAMVRSLRIRSHIAVPLVARGEIFGVISMARTGDAALYDEDDVSMAEELARRAALAIDNARLYSDARQELTERRRAEETLRAEHRIREAIEQAMTAGVATMDPDGRLTYVNPAFCAMVGWTAERLLWDDPPHPYWSEEERAENREQIRQIVKGRVSARGFETRFRCADGMVFDAMVMPSALRDEDENITGCVLAVYDITEFNQLRSDLQRRVQELAEADRQKDEFLATLSHELRNPLSPILHSTQILQATAGEGSETGRLTEMIQRHTRHMARLVDDLLDMSRITRGTIELRREQVDLCECVRSTVEGSPNLLEERQHSLALDLPDEPVLVHADAARLCQVVGNLLSNAARYTAPGGRIDIAVSVRGTNADLEVRDNGAGMSPEFVERAFEMFAQEKSSKERADSGLGIGLTLVKRLVELHDGSVRVESAGRDRGSTFIVTLPIVSQHSALVDAAPSAANGAGECRRILVVDDNEDVALSLAELLSLLGHTVRVAHDGERALTLAREETPEIAFIDIGMPGMDGYEVARRFRGDSGLDGCRLVALTGFGRADDRRMAFEAGFDIHQTKPVDLDRLCSLLSEAPSGRS